MKKAILISISFLFFNQLGKAQYNQDHSHIASLKIKTATVVVDELTYYYMLFDNMGRITSCVQGIKDKERHETCFDSLGNVVAETMLVYVMNGYFFGDTVSFLLRRIDQYGRPVLELKLEKSTDDIELGSTRFETKRIIQYFGNTSDYSDSVVATVFANDMQVEREVSYGVNHLIEQNDTLKSLGNAFDFFPPDSKIVFTYYQKTLTTCNIQIEEMTVDSLSNIISGFWRIDSMQTMYNVPVEFSRRAWMKDTTIRALPVTFFFAYDHSVKLVLDGQIIFGTWTIIEKDHLKYVEFDGMNEFNHMQVVYINEKTMTTVKSNSEYPVQVVYYFTRLK